METREAQRIACWMSVLRNGDAPGTDNYGNVFVHYVDPQDRPCNVHSPRASSDRTQEVLGGRAMCYIDPWSYALPDDCARSLRRRFARIGIDNNGRPITTTGNDAR